MSVSLVETVADAAHEEEAAMSGHHEKTKWIDRWWPLLLILFASTGIATFILFHPVH